jgi:phospholipid/cholesterol/gamma-HCH transport system substrate-binding protein
MKKSKTEFLVGLFVLLGVAAIIHLSIRAGSGTLLGGDTYLLETRFANAGGIHRGSSVMLSGVGVGRVEGVRMEPSDFSAIVTLRLPTALRLPTDSMASIKTSGLIGDKFIALSPGADEVFLEPGARIIDTESAVDLESLIGKMAFGAVDKSAESEDQAEENLP